jgi:hypothetical protein
MKDAPPEREDEEDIDGLYRRASALDDSRPSERVRNAILEHATHLARTSRPVAPQSSDARSTDARSGMPAWLRQAFGPLVGSLAVAGLAALLIAPNYLNVGARKAATSVNAVPPPTYAPEPPPAGEYGAPEPRASAPTPLDELKQPRGEQRAAQRSANNSPMQERRPMQERQNADSQPLRAAAAPPPPAPSSTAPASSPATASTTASASSIASAASPPPAPFAEIAGNTASGAAGANAGAAAPAAADRVASAARRSSNAAKALQSEPGPGATELRAAAESGDLAALDQALAKHIDLEARDAQGRTALMLATLHGQRGAVQELLRHGADPNAGDASGMSPLEAARSAHEEDIVEMLLRAGAR